MVPGQHLPHPQPQARRVRVLPGPHLPVCRQVERELGEDPGQWEPVIWPRDPVSTNHSSPQLALDEHPAGGGDEGVAGAQIPRVQGGAGGAEAFPPTHIYMYYV